MFLEEKPRNKQFETRLNVLLVTNIPFHKNPGKIIWTLKKLSQNCGGKFFKVGPNKAVIHFPTANAAAKAQKQMNKKIVYSEELSVTFHSGADFCACVCPFKRSNIQISIIKTERKIEQKNNFIAPSCSNFHLLETPALDNNIVSSLNNYIFEEYANTDESLMPCEQCMGNLQCLLQNIITLLKENGSEIRMFFFTFLYEEKYGIILCTSDYGFESIDSMLKHFPYHFKIKGKRLNRTIFLTSDRMDILNDFIRSYTSKPIIKSNMKGGYGLTSSRRTSVRSQKQRGKSSFDSKPSVSRKGFSLTSSEIPTIYDLHRRKKSFLHLKSVDEMCSFSSSSKYHAFGLASSNRESSFKTTKESLKTSFEKTISPSEVFSDFPIKLSSTLKDENKDFNIEEKFQFIQKKTYLKIVYQMII